MLVAGRACSGLSHKPRPVKILPKVPHTGHPSTAALRHRTVGSVRRERDAGKTGAGAQIGGISRYNRDQWLSP